MAEFKIPIKAVVGPTASGKTSLAVSLCEYYSGEVVSCDSMQIYKGMDIATAKPAVSEMHGIPHHLIGFAEPTEIFSVAKYCELAKNVINEIIGRNKTPFLVGGTGLYYSSLVDNIEFFAEDTDSEYRDFLKKRVESEGAQVLLDELSQIDPETASQLHVNNSVRIIRALEIYHSTGKTKTDHNEMSRKNESPFSVNAICLDARDRQVLYDRINKRVDVMLENGLLDEARCFFSSEIGSTAKQAIGYKELYPYISSQASLDECVENLKMQTRRYAKRQLTWFRRDKRIKTMYIDDYKNSDELLKAAIELLERE